MSQEEAMQEAALELNKTATPLHRATHLSEDAWALIVQNVAETRTLTENYIEKVKSINQILPGTPQEDQAIICDPLLDEMRTAASNSFLVYQYKLQILLDKAIAKKIKKKRKDEKALEREKEEAAAKLKSQAVAPEPEARSALVALEPLKKAPSETVLAVASESLVTHKPEGLPLLVPKLSLERTPSGQLKGP